MKKLTAILLAALMVCFCFATTVSAEEATTPATSEATTSEATTSEATTSEAATSEATTSEAATSETTSEAPKTPVNVAAGKAYVLTANDENPSLSKTLGDANGTLITDGAYRKGVSAEDFGTFNDNLGVAGITVELEGSYRVHSYTINLGASADVSSVILRNVRRASNRYLRLVSVEVLSGGKWTKVNYTEKADVVANAPLYAEVQGGEELPQYYDVTASFDAVAASQVRVSFDTLDAAGKNQYIAQLDEIEVMGIVTGASTDTSIGTGTTPSTPNTGDAGMVAFAVLAVVALGGAVVAKKVK